MSKKPIDQRHDIPDQAVGSASTKQSDIKSVRAAVVATADDNVNITEPSSPTQSAYPFNKVDQSLSGHLHEVDDTPGAERLMEMHKSGTFYEIHPDGTKVTKIFGKDFYIILDDHNLVVGGNLNITVQGNTNLLVKGNLKTKVSGNHETIVHGDHITRVSGKTLHYSKGDIDIQTKGEYRVKSKLSQLFQSTSEGIAFQAETTSYRSEGTFTFYAKGDMSINTGGSLHLNDENMKPPKKIKISDKDVGAGLNVPDSVMEPSFTTMMNMKTNNSNITTLDDGINTYPKDRKKIK